jgi:nitrate/TMAO reductase-like tetraheme cytochrome c subunit
MFAMRRWAIIVALLVGGAVVGATAVVTSTFVNRATSGEAFCTSCHSMANVAADPHYQQSTHRTNAAGVFASCADCHVPTDNWFVETYSHAVDGIRDGFAEYTGHFDDPGVWKARLPILAQRVRDEMTRENSSTCRKCHDAEQIHPASPAGQSAHAMLAGGNVTCINCHANIAHAPANADAATH